MTSQLSVEDYQILRKESNFSLILFSTYIAIYLAASIYLVSIHARMHLFQSLNFSVILGLTNKVFIPIFHKKAYFDQDNKTFVKSVPKGGGSLSNTFLRKQLFAYTVGLIILLISFARAAHSVPSQIHLPNLPYDPQDIQIAPSIDEDAVKRTIDTTTFSTNSND